MLVGIEERANEERNQSLEANSLRGIAAYRYPALIELDANDLPTYKFLHNLARARDGLWVKLRRSAYPAVTTFPEPFPRGLPIQYLTAPWQLNLRELEAYCPFIAQRVQAMLFPNPDVALRTAHLDDESQCAIGVFVDSYQHALKLYASKACDKEQKLEPVKRVWDYAIGSWSQGRMNEQETIRFWSDKGPQIIKDLWPLKDAIDKMRTPWPLVPVTDHPDQPFEWNPFTPGRPDSPARDLGEATYLNLSLAVMNLRDANYTVKSNLNVEKPEVPAHKAYSDGVWHPSRDMGEGGSYRLCYSWMPNMCRATVS